MRRAVNLTDVGHLTDDASDGDDKIERAARAGGKRALEIAERYFALFRADLARLNVARVDVVVARKAARWAHRLGFWQAGPAPNDIVEQRSANIMSPDVVA